MTIKYTEKFDKLIDNFIGVPYGLDRSYIVPTPEGIPDDDAYVVYDTGHYLRHLKYWSIDDEICEEFNNLQNYLDIEPFHSKGWYSSRGEIPIAGLGQEAGEFLEELVAGNELIIPVEDWQWCEQRLFLEGGWNQGMSFTVVLSHALAGSYLKTIDGDTLAIITAHKGTNLKHGWSSARMFNLGKADRLPDIVECFDMCKGSLCWIKGGEHA